MNNQVAVNILSDILHKEERRLQLIDFLEIKLAESDLTFDQASVLEFLYRLD